MEQKTISIDLFTPEKMKLATIMQNELSTNFDEATVEWVDCPDLTQDPFYLAAPGLCGNTALLDFGGMANLFPLPKKEKRFHFENIIRELNRNQINNFILGGGLCVQSDKYLGELIMNALFSPAVDGTMILRNQSQCAHQKINNTTCSFSGKTIKQYCALGLITDLNPSCNIYGNFFVSQGLRGQVLKVQAKKRTGRDFIDALQHAIRRFPHKTDSQLMGLGGTFIVKNGRAIQHVVQNNWMFPIFRKDEIRDCITFWNVRTPVVGFATFINADRHIVNMNSGLKEVFLTRWRAHSRGYIENGGGHYHGTKLNYTTEYLGYFSLATKLHRIDPVPIFCELADFSYL